MGAASSAPPAPTPRSSPLAWVERGLEGDVRAEVARARALRQPTWLFVRGRRQVGKTQLVRRVLRGLPNVVFVLLHSGTVLADFADALGERLTSHAALAAALKRRILAKEAVVVIDEIQHASAAEQGVLQGVVDDVKGEVLHGRRACGGGMILLGSHTQRADDINMGHGAPLWDRMTQHRTVLPFQPEELAVVFARHGIVSSRARLLVASLTGGYPAQLVLLAQEGALREGAEVRDIAKALAKHERALSSVFEGELGADLSSVAQKVVSKTKAADGLEAAQAALAGRQRGVCAADVASYVERLQRYGVIRLLRPMFDLPSRDAPSREQFVISDPRWAWYNAMRNARAVQATDGAQDVLLSISATQVNDIQAHLGWALESRVGELICARARLALRPIIPAWAVDAVGGAPAPLVLDTCSAPLVLEGKQLGFEGDLDGVVIFLAERIVVYVGCKVSSAALFSKELKRLPSSPSASMQALGDGAVSRTQRHAASLLAALSRRSPRCPDGADARTSADEVCDVLLHAAQTHFVFVTADDELREKAPRFLEQLAAPARLNVSFATFADFYEGLPAGAHAQGPPDGGCALDCSHAACG